MDSVTHHAEQGGEDEHRRLEGEEEEVEGGEGADGLGPVYASSESREVGVVNRCTQPQSPLLTLLTLLLILFLSPRHCTPIMLILTLNPLPQHALIKGHLWYIEYI